MIIANIVIAKCDKFFYLFYFLSSSSPLKLEIILCYFFPCLTLFVHHLLHSILHIRSNYIFLTKVWIEVKSGQIFFQNLIWIPVQKFPSLEYIIGWEKHFKKVPSFRYIFSLGNHFQKFSSFVNIFDKKHSEVPLY